MLCKTVSRFELMRVHSVSLRLSSVQLCTLKSSILRPMSIESIFKGPKSYFSSDSTNGKGTPLPTITGSGPRVKRKSWIDLRAPLQQESEILCELQHGASKIKRVTNQQNESSLRSDLGKKQVACSKGKTNHHQSYGANVRTRNEVNSYPLVELFDICSQQCCTHSFGEDTDESCKQLDQCMKESGQVLRPGMVLLKRYISLAEQVEIVKKCRELGLGPGGFYRPGYKDGAKLRLQMMCLGRIWDPQTRYKVGQRPDGFGAPGIPDEFNLLVKKAIQDSQNIIKKHDTSRSVEEMLPAMSPDVCIVNFYKSDGRLGLHQDRDESLESLQQGLPVVSISIGDTAEFLFGDQRDIDMAEKVWLESGDVLLFGGKSRLIYHGVTAVVPNSAPPALLDETMLRPGRLNLTFRRF